MAALLLPREYAIDRLRYFTARVSGKLDPRAPARQQNYLKALSTLPEVDIHYGRFLTKTAWRPVANLPVAGRRIDTPRPVTLPQGDHRVLGGRVQTLPVGVYPDRRGGGGGAPRGRRTPLRDAVIAEFHTMEEKGSDVNLAAYLLNDAWKDLFEAAVSIPRTLGGKGRTRIRKRIVTEPCLTERIRGRSPSAAMASRDSAQIRLRYASANRRDGIRRVGAILGNAWKLPLKQ